MIKVLHVVNDLPLGGAERNTLNQCRFSKVTEPRVFAFLCGSALFDADKSSILPAFQEAKIPVIVGNLKNKPLIEAVQWADIVSYHYTTPVAHHLFHKAIRAVEYCNKPAIVNLHLAIPLKEKLSYPIVCTSRHAAGRQMPYNRAIGFHTGIDLTQFVYRPKPIRDEFIIIRVCRPDKCQPYFWDGIKIVLETLPNAKVWIVGQETPEKGGGFHHDKIKFLGKREDVPELLAQSDIFAYTPDVGYGTYDNVVQEALATGTPCVCSDVPCVKAVDHGKTGILTPFGDVKEFVKAIVFLAHHREIREKMGKQGAEVALKRFDARDGAAMYDRIYQFILTRI